MILHYLLCVIQGRFLSGSISNISGDSCSTFNQSTSASNAHHQGIISGTSEHYNTTVEEFSPATVEEVSPATVEEVSSKFVIGKSDADHLHAVDGLTNLSPQPEVSLALRNLAMQLSLEDDDENTVYFGEKFPAFPNEYEKSQDFGFLDHKTRKSLPEANEIPFRGMEYLEENQVEAEKQDGYGSTQLLKVSGYTDDCLPLFSLIQLFSFLGYSNIFASVLIINLETPETNLISLTSLSR